MTTLNAVPAPAAHEHESEADLLLKMGEARKALKDCLSQASVCLKKGDAFQFQMYKKRAMRHRAALDVYSQLHASRAIANQK